MKTEKPPAVAKTDKLVPPKKVERRRGRLFRAASRQPRLIAEFQSDATEVEQQAPPRLARVTLYGVLALIAFEKPAPRTKTSRDIAADSSLSLPKLRITSVVLSACWVPGATAQTARGPHETIDNRLTSSRPGSPTGFSFTGAYHAAGNAHAYPPYMQKPTTSSSRRAMRYWSMATPLARA